MTKQMTREEIKAAKRAANVALTAEIRSLVAAGNDDKAIALVADKPASWLQIVTDAKAARDAKADKAAAKAAAEAEAAAAPVVAAVVAPAPAPAPANDVEAIVAAAVAKAVAEALAAVSAAPAPVAAAPVANVFDLPNENAANVAKGLGRKIAGKVDRVLASGDTAAALQALQDARQCAAWCSAARSGEADKATADRLASAERSYDKAAARLNAALGGQ